MQVLFSWRTPWLSVTVVFVGVCRFIFIAGLSAVILCVCALLCAVLCCVAVRCVVFCAALCCAVLLMSFIVSTPLIF